MKKTLKKLTLSRETVIHLNQEDLQEAAGGSNGPSECASWCSQIAKRC